MSATRIFDAITLASDDPPLTGREQESARDTLVAMYRASKGSPAQQLAGKALAEAAHWTEARMWLARSTGWTRTCESDKADALLDAAGVPMVWL